MTEIYIPLPSKEVMPLYLQQDFDGFLIGIKNFSSNFNYLYNVDELESVLKELKKENKKIFISLDRLYYNDEIEKVKELLIGIKDLDITGICYTDIGVLNILNDINYKKEIFWLSNHLGTNSKTINFLEKKDVSYALLSTEITADEIINIKKNTNIKIGAFLYGFLNMATSSRKLLSNYFAFIDKKKKNNSYIMKDKNKDDKYIVVENTNTNFYTDEVLNGIKFLPSFIENKLDFIVLDDYMLDSNNFYNIIEAFSSLRKAYDDKTFVSNLEKVVEANTFNDTFYGFLEKRTVYKVEDYGKN